MDFEGVRSIHDSWTLLQLNAQVRQQVKIESRVKIESDRHWIHWDQDKSQHEARDITLHRSAQGDGIEKKGPQTCNTAIVV